MKDKQASSGSVIAVAFGMLVGLVLGFLYAPRPGKETRELVREKAVEAKKKVAEIADEAKKEAQSRMEKTLKETE